MHEFPITRAAQHKPKPDPKTLSFGKVFTDHMFLMNYTPEQGWHDGRIVPYAPISLEPSATADQEYTLESSDPGVASVTGSGLVTAHRTGAGVRRALRHSSGKTSSSWEKTSSRRSSSSPA